MSFLEKYQNAIQEKVKNTSFRDFIKNIAGWYPMNFYKRDGIISVFPNTPRSPNIVSPKKFSELSNDPLKYWREYDFKVSFFENYKKLFTKAPFSALRQFPIVENSEYTDSSGWGTHNCYLDIGLYDVENVLYSFEVKENCRNVLNSVMVWNNCENVYQSNCVVRSSMIFYSRYILESHNVWFSTNLVGCHDCFFVTTWRILHTVYKINHIPKNNMKISKWKWWKIKKDLRNIILDYRKMVIISWVPIRDEPILPIRGM